MGQLCIKTSNLSHQKSIKQRTGSISARAYPVMSALNLLFSLLLLHLLISKIIICNTNNFLILPGLTLFNSKQYVVKEILTHLPLDYSFSLHPCWSEDWNLTLNLVAKIKLHSEIVSSWIHSNRRGISMLKI